MHTQRINLQLFAEPEAQDQNLTTRVAAATCTGKRTDQEAYK